MNQNNPLYAYTIVDQKATKDFSVVGVIDGSGSMGECWPFLSAAWNEFINDVPSSFCIQFDDEAQLQNKPLLTYHMGENTNISAGFFELIKLIKSGKLKKNAIIVFITDGVGDDKVEDYIDKLAQEFSVFHDQEYQFKLFTLATGTEFSHTIVAELKNRIHNSTLISSQMEYVLNYEVDFKEKLQQIKEEIFYNMVRVEPAVQLVPNGKKLNKLAPNQTIITDKAKIKINDEMIDLENYVLTYNDIYQLANQIMLKLMEDSTRGLNSVKDSAQEQLLTIERLMKKINDNSPEAAEMKRNINETLQKIQGFAEGKQQLQALSATEAAKSIAKLQTAILQNTVKRQDNYKPQPVKNEKKDKAIKKLAGMKKSVKIKTIFDQIQTFFQGNQNSSPQLLVKLLQEKKGGQQLQRYALEFEKECQELFELLHISNS